MSKASPLVLLLCQVARAAVRRVKVSRGRWAWEIAGRAADLEQAELLETAVERELITVPQPSESTVRVLVMLTPKGVTTVQGR